MMTPSAVWLTRLTGNPTPFTGGRSQGAVIMKKMEIADVAKDLEKLYKKIDKKAAKYGSLSDDDIDKIIQASRRKRYHSK